MAHAEAIDGSFAIEPDDLARLELSMVRRGYDPDEVKALLASTAETVRELKEENESLRRRLEAAEATQALDEARLEGEQLVNEARLVRRRMLEDLAQRRATMGRQIEQLRAGRDRLIEAFELIRQTVDDATQELTVAMPQAQAAAARAGARAPEAMDIDDLEEEMEMARVADLPIIQARDDETVEVVDEVLDDESDVEDLFARLREESDERLASKAEATEPAPDEAPEAIEAEPEAAAEAESDEAQVEVVDEPEVDQEEPEPLTVVETALAGRVKRALADEQNAALERVRSRRARTVLDADRILGGSASERLQRYELVVAPHLDEAAAIAGGAAPGGLATQIADRLVTSIHAEVAAAVDEAQDDEELTRLIRNCFRRVKTEDVGELAAEFVQAAAAPDSPG